MKTLVTADIWQNTKDMLRCGVRQKAGCDPELSNDFDAIVLLV